MKRTRLLNRFRKNRTTENQLAYKRQRNFCTNLLKKVKASHYRNLKPSSICDNKKFWNTVKPLFSDKCISTDNITLIENNKIISEDQDIANTVKVFIIVEVYSQSI